MKKLLYILLSLGLLVVVSCQKDGDDTAYSEAMPSYDGSEANNAPPKGVYDVAWIVDKEIVDTATLTVGAKKNNDYTPISHFPMRYFLELVGKKADPEDFIYEWCISDWLINYRVIGFSESKLYLKNWTWAPRINFGVKDETYSFLIYMNDETNVENWYTSMVYDKEKDIWSGATPVYKFQMFNHATNESWDMTFPVPINMSFQTTGRKK